MMPSAVGRASDGESQAHRRDHRRLVVSGEELQPEFASSHRVWQGRDARWSRRHVSDDRIPRARAFDRVCFGHVHWCCGLHDCCQELDLGCGRSSQDPRQSPQLATEQRALLEAVRGADPGGYGQSQARIRVRRRGALRIAAEVHPRYRRRLGCSSCECSRR